MYHMNSRTHSARVYISFVYGGDHRTCALMREQKHTHTHTATDTYLGINRDGCVCVSLRTFSAGIFTFRMRALEHSEHGGEHLRPIDGNGKKVFAGARIVR